MIFVKSYWPDEFPRYWKKDNVAPMCLKGSKDDPGNYHLVRHTSVLVRIMEQILLGAVLTSMEDREVVQDKEYGFTKGKS